MAGKELVYAIASLVIGGALGYFWSTSRPQDSVEIVIGISILAIGLIYFSLHSMGKH